MNEDLTRDLPERSFQERVLSGLASIDGRLTTLEEKVDRLDGRLTTLEEKVDRLDGRMTALEGRMASHEARLTTLEEKVDRRLQETRPIWEDVLTKLRQLDDKFTLVIDDLYEVRSDQVSLRRRVERLEKTPAQ